MFTILLILINVIVFFLIYTNKLDVDDLGCSYHLVFNRKDYKRIITSSFTHEQPIHLIFNMLSLYNVGSFVESTYGSTKFLIIYFGSMILGKLITLYIRHNNNNDYAVSIGASGAICGIMGAYFMFVLFFMGVSGLRYLARPLISLAMISMFPGVDGTSHFSSMAVGMAISCLFIFF